MHDTGAHGRNARVTSLPRLFSGRRPPWRAIETHRNAVGTGSVAVGWCGARSGPSTAWGVEMRFTQLGRVPGVALGSLVAAGLACAQAPSKPGAPQASPYAGEEAREIKALSEQEVAGLLAGAGLGYARAAELNGWPGPRHVLDLADELALSAAQREASQAAFDRMQEAARTVGAELVAAERELDRRFAERSIDRPALDALTARIGAIEARLRAVHLAAHLEQTALLDASQVQRYMVLRGYGGGADARGRHAHGAHGHGAHATPATAPAPDPGALTATETAFARAMAERDFEAFAAFIHDEAVFINGGSPLRGKPAILAHWKGFFEGPDAPFAWAPEIAEVSAGNGLGYTEGPVRRPDGSSRMRFYSIWKLQPDGRWMIVFDNGYRVGD